MLNKYDLVDTFNDAIRNENEFVGVLIKFEKRREPELIINSKGNLHYKLKYYKNNYDRFLSHKHASSVQIVDCARADSVDKIGELLL